MRMLHYFGALAALSTLGLVATALTGVAFAGGEVHLTTGLFTAILVVGTHTLLIVFMIVTGRVLKAAMASRPLGPEFLAELNDFFGRKQAYPAAVSAAVLVVATGVLGYAKHAFGLPPAVHMLAGLATLLVNLWVFGLELRALQENQALLDRAASELDRIDTEQADLAVRAALEEAAPRPGEASKRWLIVGVSVWMPYLYWVFVVWRGDFAQVSVHPWLEVSAFALVAAWLVRPRSGSPEQPGGAESTTRES
jgi:hypothetical protein